MATTPDPFTELADEAAAADAAGERARTRWLRQQAAEEATLAGTLLDLAESGATAAVQTASGRVHRGHVSRVGADFVAVDDTWIRFASIVTIRPSGRHRDGGAPRAAVHATRFNEALGERAPERPSVVVGTATGEALRGTLVAVGVDVLTLTLAPDGDARDGVCVVPLGAVADATFVA